MAHTSRQKLLIGTMVALIAIFIFLALYVFVLRGEPAVPPEAGEFFPSPEEVLVESTGIDPDAPLVQLTTEPVAGFDITETGEVVTVTNAGTVRIMDETGVAREEYELGLSPVVAARVSSRGDAVAFKVLDVSLLTGRWYVWKRGEDQPELLPENVRDVLFAPDGTLTRVEEDTKHGATNIVVGTGGEARTVLSSRIPDLRVRWVDNAQLLLTTAPSGSAPGIAYTFNTRTRATTQLLGEHAGLTAVLDSAGNALFSEAVLRGGRLRTSVLGAGESRNTPLPVVTLPERCTPPRGGEALCSTIESQHGADSMPDDYYKGTVVNSQSEIVRVNFRTGTVSSLASVPFDATDPRLSPDGRHLFTVNKNDGLLWRVRLGQ